jgi:hypothetical protein
MKVSEKKDNKSDNICFVISVNTMASAASKTAAAKKIFYEGWLDKKSPSGIIIILILTSSFDHRSSFLVRILRMSCHVMLNRYTWLSKMAKAMVSNSRKGHRVCSPNISHNHYIL